ncbi:MAG: hypothetical protein ACNA78_10795 [Balneolaceae bacterium]
MLTSLRTSHRFLFFSILIAGMAMALYACSDQSVQPIDDNETPPPTEGTFNHKQAPGASNSAFVTDQTFDELVIEIQYMPGAAPRQQSIDNLVDFLSRHIDKSSIIIQDPVEIPSGGQESYTAADVRDLEEEHRQTFTQGNRLASYALFLDGEFSSRNVLGIAYFNTSTAYFSETIQSISGGLGQPSRVQIESTVLYHEYGHLFGLVNNGTEMQDDHHDVENGAHCTVEECVMYHAVNTADFFANLFGGTIPDFESFCQADLAALRQ